MPPGIRSCMPGRMSSGLASVSLFASRILRNASPDFSNAAEIVHSESPGFTM